MDTEQHNAHAWTAYGEHHLARGTDVPEVERLAWGHWPDVGPGEEILGDLTGRRVLDLGSGIGKYPAYLARRGAQVDAVEASPSQHARALARYGQQPGLRLICADAVAYFRQADPYDVIYSIHGIPYIDPNRLLPVLAAALLPCGRLLFSALHTNAAGEPPSTAVAARPEILPLAGGGKLSVSMWVLTPTLWEDLLVEHGLLVDQINLIAAPEEDNPVSCTLIHARRPTAPADGGRG